MPTTKEEFGHRTLLICVQLSASEIHQRWIPDSVENSGSSPAVATLRVAGLRIVLEDSIPARDRVQFHLQQTTLNEYTDSHRIPRIFSEPGTKSYSCQVFTRLTQLIIPSLESPKLSSPTFLKHFVMLLCAHIVHLNSSGVPESSQSRGGLSAWQKRVAIEFLAKNRYENTKLSTLASQCHLSVSHFSRSFRTSFGMPVHRWLVKQRVEKAKDLLLRSNSSLIEVAFQAGFTDQATFNRTFTKIVGTSPGRWRKANKES